MKKFLVIEREGHYKSSIDLRAIASMDEYENECGKKLIEIKFENGTCIKVPSTEEMDIERLTCSVNKIWRNIQ